MADRPTDAVMTDADRIKRDLTDRERAELERLQTDKRRAMAPRVPSLQEMLENIARAKSRMIKAAMRRVQG